MSFNTFDQQTYLSTSAQRAGALAEVVPAVRWGLQRTHQTVQVIKAPICRQLFQGRQRAADINTIIGLSGGSDWNKWSLCLIDDVKTGSEKVPMDF